MPILVMTGLLSILVAFISYTFGIWGAWRAKGPKASHLVALWVGFAGDALGTCLMAAQIGYYRLDVHGIIGTAGIAIMLATAVWATLVARQGDATASARYAKLAVIAWVVWLIPFTDGFLARGK